MALAEAIGRGVELGRNRLGRAATRFVHLKEIQGTLGDQCIVENGAFATLTGMDRR